MRSNGKISISDAPVALVYVESTIYLQLIINLCIIRLEILPTGRAISALTMKCTGLQLVVRLQVNHHEVVEIIEVTRAVVLGNFAPVSIQVQRRETVHLLFIAQLFARFERTVNLHDVHVLVAEELFTQLLPCGRETLTVAAPGRKKFDERETLFDTVLETIGSQAQDGVRCAVSVLALLIRFVGALAQHH